MNRRRGKARLATINVIPYIDVMLVLLVIFMVAAPLMKQEIKIKLPQARSNTVSVKVNSPLVIKVDQEGQYYLNTSLKPQQSLSAQDLLTAVAAHWQIAQDQQKTMPIYIEGDQRVNYGTIIRVMSLLQTLGIKDIKLVTHPLQSH